MESDQSQIAQTLSFELLSPTSAVALPSLHSALLSSSPLLADTTRPRPRRCVAATRRLHPVLHARAPPSPCRGASPARARCRPTSLTRPPARRLRPASRPACRLRPFSLHRPPECRLHPCQPAALRRLPARCLHPCRLPPYVARAHAA